MLIKDSWEDGLWITKLVKVEPTANAYTWWGGKFRSPLLIDNNIKRPINVSIHINPNTPYRVSRRNENNMAVDRVGCMERQKVCCTGACENSSSSHDWHRICRRVRQSSRVEVPRGVPALRGGLVCNGVCPYSLHLRGMCIELTLPGYTNCELGKWKRERLAAFLPSEKNTYLSRHSLHLLLRIVLSNAAGNVSTCC